MQNPKFGVTAFTATVLTIICVGKVVLFPHLPPSATESLVTIDRRNAPPAAAVELNWQTIPSRAVEDATKLRKALLWVIIDPRDANARELETGALRDAEVVRLVKRYFVPVKLNSDDHPEVERLIFPVGRAQTYLRSGATVLATTPQGHIIGMIRPRGAGDRLSTPSVLLQLLALKRKLDSQIAKPDLETELDLFAKAETQRLLGITPSAPPTGQESLVRIRSALVSKLGVFSSNGFGEVRPSTLNLLIELGEIDLASKLVETYATSVGYDVIGGGVFDGIELLRPTKTIASKSVLTNVAFAESVALLQAIKPTPQRQALLEDVLNCVSREFIQDADIFEGRISDADVSGLSPRFSLTGSRIDAILSPSESDWVRSHLLPKPVPGDYMGRLESLNMLTDPLLKNVREKLKPYNGVDVQRTRENRAYVIGFTCARMLRVYQLTNSPLALQIFRRLEPALYGCFEGNQVLRISRISTSGDGWLGSYLSVADALLQQYLVLAERKPLEKAPQVLRGILQKFGNSSVGWLTVAAGGKSPIPGFAGTSPDMADPGYESTAATAIRVLDRYVPVLEDRDLAKAIRNRASTMVSVVKPLTQGANITVSGIVREAISASRGRQLEVFGSCNPVAQAFPLDYAYPSPDGSKIPPVIYIHSEGRRLGPYTLAQARQQLSAR